MERNTYQSKKYSLQSKVHKFDTVVDIYTYVCAILLLQERFTWKPILRNQLLILTLICHGRFTTWYFTRTLIFHCILYWNIILRLIATTRNKDDNNNSTNYAVVINWPLLDLVICINYIPSVHSKALLPWYC